LLEHGGRIRAAARRWGIPHGQWLDLSTGIAPWPYPLPPLPAEVWQRLPEEDDGLEDAARDYYGAHDAVGLLALPGSQAAIQALPRLFPAGRVALPTPIYNEHPAAWQAAGHARVGWDEAADYAVVCHPNNPTGKRYTRAELLERAARVKRLIVDEAFIDAEPDASLIGCGAENVIVLRSLGKFFGLAGARIGFAFAAADLLARLADALGPWAVSHPARWAARQALADRAWQARQRARLSAASQRLDGVLRENGVTPCGGCALFRYAVTPRAGEIGALLARAGILVRRCAAPPALRFGLPAEENAWNRLMLAFNRRYPQ